MNTRQAHLTSDQVTALIAIGDKVDDLAHELDADGVAAEAVAHYAHACHHISEASNALLEAMRFSSHPVTQASKRVVLSLCADDAYDLAHLLKDAAQALEKGPRDLKVTTEDADIRMGRDGLMVGTIKVADKAGGHE
ncbi:hypothetical protein EI168_02605 [Halomonas sp. FME1]|uniref:Uncharacterized protein n=1 Tax=Halomonas casei TaxID=2742613 RepID=A0ABR9EXQ3_9GAMM|nr:MULTISPECIES: hypothetical protein [Halomonas]MBE0398999.1 hypothetical protein [Halomonas casei]PCC23015.1 hypothetical protein CIK78_13640 [Halomonas sp. JB37]